MKKVTILAPYNTMATTIFGPMDILNQAGRLWNRVTGASQTPFFDVTIASADGRPIRSVNNIYRKIFVRLTGLRPHEYQRKFTGCSGALSQT